MFIARPPKLLRNIYKQATWRKVADKPTVYLTFDDGPIPEVTPWVLDQLDTYQVKATFFCVGDNARKHRGVYNDVLNRGHHVGNHTFNHIQSVINKNSAYITNVRKATPYIKSNLFRPPHGQLRPGLLSSLVRDYEVIMWDVLSGDYDATTPEEVVFERVKKYTRDGSIIVFHDSLKAKKNLYYALPRSIAYLQEQGYNFGLL